MGNMNIRARQWKLGIKYYILKPCDEERMLPVIEKVKEEIRGKTAGKTEI